jgi:hypothetical protein
VVFSAIDRNIAGRVAHRVYNGGIMTPNNFSNISVVTTLVAGIGVGDLSMTVVDATGYPVVPFAVVIDAGSVANEEAVLVTTKVGTLWTISRAYDGTMAKVHSAGATVIHAALARDFRGLILGTREMSTALPANGDAVVWNNGAATWEPGAVSGGGVVPFSYATATLTLDTQPSDSKTMVIGVQTYTFVIGAQTNPGDIVIGATLTDTQTNVVSGVNGSDFFNVANPDAALLPFSTDQAAVVASVAGVIGNGVALSGDFAGEGGNGFSGAALSGGSDGTTGGDVQLESASIVAPSPATVALRVQPAIGVANLAAVYHIVEIRDENGVLGAAFDAFGTLDLFAGLNVNNGALQVGSSGQFTVQPTSPGDIANFRTSAGDIILLIRGQDFSGVFEITPRFAHQIPIIIYSYGGEADHIQATGLPDFNNVFRVLQRGAVVTAQHTAPDDAQLNTGDMSIWFDQTDGASKFMIKGKSADGTVVSGEVALA